MKPRILFVLVAASTYIYKLHTCIRTGFPSSLCPQLGQCLDPQSWCSSSFASIRSWELPIEDPIWLILLLFMPFSIYLSAIVAPSFSSYLFSWSTSRNSSTESDINSPHQNIYFSELDPMSSFMLITKKFKKRKKNWIRSLGDDVDQFAA